MTTTVIAASLMMGCSQADLAEKDDGETTTPQTLEQKAPPAYEQDLKLAWKYRNGDGVKQDFVISAQHFLAASQAGSMEATFELGYMYHRGWGVHRSTKEARRLYRIAAEGGNVHAQFNMAIGHHDGIYGYRQDDTQAFYWYTQASAQGHANAQLHLGGMHQYGRGTQKDLDKARELYLKSANQGNEQALRRLKELH